MARFDEKCDRGVLRDLILPPSWLLRLSNIRKRRKQNYPKLSTSPNISVLNQNTQFSQSHNLSTANEETKKTKRKVIVGTRVSIRMILVSNICCSAIRRLPTGATIIGFC